MHFDVAAHTVYLARHGSLAYGTNIATSDVDIKGFAIAPKSWLLGFAYTFEQDEQREPEDKVVYDIRKFCGLAAECNPNIIEVLFVDDQDVLKMHPAGRLIRENRDLFLSKRAKQKFSGYAMSQLKRIRTHRGYLLSPPTHKPTREEFGLSIDMKITSAMMGAFDKVRGDGEHVDANVMELVAQEKRYKAALDTWHAHENWKSTRNEKRARLEAEHGYDTKHAMHLVRLLRMCLEILEGQGVIVRRPDARELRSIREGAWSYERLIAWAEAQEAAIETAMQRSPLDDMPNMAKLNDLCVEAIEHFWRAAQ